MLRGQHVSDDRELDSDNSDLQIIAIDQADRGLCIIKIKFYRNGSLVVLYLRVRYVKIGI